MRQILPYTVAICLALFLLSCEKEKTDLIEVSLNSPFVSSLALRTSSVNLDTTTGSAVIHLPDGSYTISDTATATVRIAGGLPAIRRVAYYLFQPDQQNYFELGYMDFAGSTDSEATFTAPFSFTIRRPDIGAYRIEVIAENQTKLLSNSLVASVVISRNNIRPQLYALSAPDTLVRPVSGRRPVFFAVSASDSDGQRDINSVFFRSINSNSSTFEFQLYDDGNLAVSGDSVANNGRYSRVIPIDSTATLGTKEFRFWARDKAGALSDSLVRFITIIPTP